MAKQYGRFALVFLPFFSAILSSAVEGDECVQKGTCICSTSTGKIDLTPLANTDGNPRFLDVKEKAGQWYYSYNPCNSFSQGRCRTVAVCKNDHIIDYYNLGGSFSAKFRLDKDGKTHQIQYTAQGSGQTMQTYVNLVCDPNLEGTLDPKGEDPLKPGTYYLTLTTKYACLPGHQKPGEVSLSIGTILLIVFAVLLLMYLAGGFLFTTLVRKSSGRQMIPNAGFWSALPGLIRDGALFAIRCGRLPGYSKT